MWPFRKSLDLSRAVARPVTGDDLPGITRLLRDGGRRYYGFAGGDLPAILAAQHGVALDAAGELYAVALHSPPSQGTCWLRAVALAEGLEVRGGVTLLLAELHAHLVAAALDSVYFAGDETVESWLPTALVNLGYLHDTEVIVYEKSQLGFPDEGNLAAHLRPAHLSDLAAVLRIDAACFEPHWTKGDTVLGPAMEFGPYFTLAELHGRAVGYAYATTHFGGRLLHLVRIAVEPAYRGERVGVRLLSDLVTYAEEIGAHTITLNTQAYNLAAQRLYRWFGFVATGERQQVLRRPLP
jgi:ribosomal protein S18 acetylase RimI-like enzyme